MTLKQQLFIHLWALGAGISLGMVIANNYHTCPDTKVYPKVKTTYVQNGIPQWSVTITNDFQLTSSSNSWMKYEFLYDK